MKFRISEISKWRHIWNGLSDRLSVWF